MGYGSDIKVINESIKKIGKEFNLTEDQMNKCLDDKDLEKKYLMRELKLKKIIK